MRDFTAESTYPRDVRKWSSIYDMSLDGIDANDTSLQERMNKGILSERKFTYGEVCFANFIPMLNFVAPRPSEKFYDLGCGTGKPLMIAAVAFPKLAYCKGIELLKDLAIEAKQVNEKF